MTDRRARYHLGVLLGLSAAAYAGTLAAVTAEQAGSEARVAAAREPLLDAAARARAGNDRLQQHLDAISSRYQRGLDGYDRLVAGLGGLDGDLSALATIVADIQGVAKDLPARVSLPAVTRTVRTVVKPAPPATHGTTGASGG